MFSEHRELALSVVSCLLPSSSTPSPRAASRLDQLGFLQQNTAVMGLPWTQAVPRVCPVLSCLALWPLGALCPGKEGSWGSPSSNMTDSLHPSLFFSSTSSFHQISSCGGSAWLLFWPGFWATPLSGHLSREAVRQLTVCKNPASRMRWCWQFCHHRLLLMIGCPKFPADQGLQAGPQNLLPGTYPLFMESGKIFPFKACSATGMNSASLPK